MVGDTSRRALMLASAGVGVAATGVAAGSRRARAQQSATIRIGVLTSLSGPYTAVAGPGSVLAARMAVADFMREHRPGFRVEILEGDIRDRVDVGLNTARTWLDREGVDAITDVSNSALTLALVPLLRERDKVGLFGSSPLTTLTGANCSPNHVQWVYDTHAVAATAGRAMVEQGGDSWFFVTADYAFGHALANDTAEFVKQAGGRVVGTVAFPFPDTTDFSSFLVQAQSSRAKVVGLAAAGANMTNLIKQAAEFGVARRGQRLVSLLLVITDVHALGLEAAQGLVLSSPFYWDLNKATRAFSRRFAPEMRGAMPTMHQAGTYSDVLHYLKAVAAVGPERARASGRAAVERMKAIPTDDPLFGRGVVRADGRKIHDFHLFRVKSPAESRYAWDYYERLQTVPGDAAFRSLEAGGCPLVRG